jgi:hypothetical protein
MNTSDRSRWLQPAKSRVWTSPATQLLGAAETLRQLAEDWQGNLRLLSIDPVMDAVTPRAGLNQRTRLTDESTRANHADIAA